MENTTFRYIVFTVVLIAALFPMVKSGQLCSKITSGIEEEAVKIASALKWLLQTSDDIPYDNGFVSRYSYSGFLYQGLEIYASCRNLEQDGCQECLQSAYDFLKTCKPDALGGASIDLSCTMMFKQLY